FELFGVTEHTLRFYTDEGLLHCERDGGNRRIPAGSDVKKVHRGANKYANKSVFSERRYKRCNCIHARSRRI
ncbi:MAG: MerR family DNA-binding transcriptional regulator, partial [Christensenellales bacterium]